MLGKLIFNKLGIAIKEIVTGFGLVAVTAATGLVVYNVMSGDNSSNAVNTASNNGGYSSNVQYGSGGNTQIGSGGITTGSIGDAAQAASQSGYTVGNPSPAPAANPAGGSGNWSPSNAIGNPDQSGQAASGLLQTIGDQAKAQKQAQSDLFGNINKQLADAQNAAGTAQAQTDAANKLKNFEGLGNMSGSGKPGSMTYSPSAPSGGSGGAGGPGSDSAAQKLAQQQLKNMQSNLEKARSGRLTGMGGSNAGISAGQAVKPSAGGDMLGAGTQANQIRKALADAGSQKDLASTVIGDIYQNAGQQQGGVQVSGGNVSESTPNPTINDVAKVNPNQKTPAETIDVGKAAADLKAARANQAWAIFMAAVVGGIALATVVATISMSQWVKWVVVGIGLAAIGFAMYEVLRNYSDGVNIGTTQKIIMGTIMTAVMAMILVVAVECNSASTFSGPIAQFFNTIGTFVDGLLSAGGITSMLGYLGLSVIVGTPVQKLMSSSTKTAKANYDAAKAGKSISNTGNTQLK
ncbi:MAG: hypothetical protein FWF35_05060 [Elusimicrobia bacterium]|nr:hypothetical protein [Elusimicrobiota bacterium]